MSEHHDADAERTTGELIQALGEDCSRAFEELSEVIDTGKRDESGQIDVDYEYKARQFIRTVFAYIEATTFSVKASSAVRCMDSDIDISPQERYFSVDTEYELNDQGEVVDCRKDFSCKEHPLCFFPESQSSQRRSAIRCLRRMVELLKRRNQDSRPSHPSKIARRS